MNARYTNLHFQSRDQTIAEQFTRTNQRAVLAALTIKLHNYGTSRVFFGSYNGIDAREIHRNATAEFW